MAISHELREQLTEVVKEACIIAATGRSQAASSMSETGSTTAEDHCRRASVSRLAAPLIPIIWEEMSGKGQEEKTHDGPFVAPL